MISTLQQLTDSRFDEKQVKVFMKRDDLIHPFISGNKFRKLKYNLQEAMQENQHTLLTFGGAFSNHIYAVAAAGKEVGLNTIGIIRGEKILPLNKTLQFVSDQGMQLHFISRETYKQKELPDYIQNLHTQFGDFYLLPEGGTNLIALKGCSEIIDEIEMPYDYICCPCGTGGTLAGLIAGDQGKKALLGFSVLKRANDLEGKIMQLANDFSGRSYNNWTINHDFHFGGYAKTTEQLFSFISDFEQKQNILLDPVYTGKMMAGIFEMVRQDFFRKGTTVIALHTGGLQGWSGFLNR